MPDQNAENDAPAQEAQHPYHKVEVGQGGPPDPKPEQEDSGGGPSVEENVAGREGDGPDPETEVAEGDPLEKSPTFTFDPHGDRCALGAFVIDSLAEYADDPEGRAFCGQAIPPQLTAGLPDEAWSEVPGVDVEGARLLDNESVFRFADERRPRRQDQAKRMETPERGPEIPEYVKNAYREAGGDPDDLRAIENGDVLTAVSMSDAREGEAPWDALNRLGRIKERTRREGRDVRGALADAGFREEIGKSASEELAKGAFREDPSASDALRVQAAEDRARAMMESPRSRPSETGGPTGDRESSLGGRIGGEGPTDSFPGVLGAQLHRMFKGDGEANVGAGVGCSPTGTESSGSSPRRLSDLLAGVGRRPGDHAPGSRPGRDRSSDRSLRDGGCSPPSRRCCEAPCPESGSSAPSHGNGLAIAAAAGVLGCAGVAVVGAAGVLAGVAASSPPRR